MLEFGDVILAIIQYTDTNESKKRPAVVLFQESSNIVVAGMTSNLDSNGIPVSKSEGAIKDSIIKTSYIFTLGDTKKLKKLFSLNDYKKELLCREMRLKICGNYN